MSDEDEEPEHTFTLVRERYHRLLRQFDFDAVGRRYDYCNVNYAVLVGILHLLSKPPLMFDFFAICSSYKLVFEPHTINGIILFTFSRMFSFLYDHA